MGVIGVSIDVYRVYRAEYYAEGEYGNVMLYLTLFFESTCFPIIVALGVRGLGKHAKGGSGFIIAGVSGGAAVSNSHLPSFQ